MRQVQHSHGCNSTRNVPTIKMLKLYKRPIGHGISSRASNSASLARHDAAARGVAVVGDGVCGVVAFFIARSSSGAFEYKEYRKLFLGCRGDVGRVGQVGPHAGHVAPRARASAPRGSLCRRA